MQNGVMPNHMGIQGPAMGCCPPGMMPYEAGVPMPGMMMPYGAGAPMPGMMMPPQEHQCQE
ncbi:hypothetical protein KHA80_17835 [Anaerobacillus sp. HL2]|nr:hypothetical protein KHA80_17835 [Anaerobacillus sp. HL2]